MRYSQGSILGPLLFLLYINNFHIASDLLDRFMFADETNLFCSNKDINTAFHKVNDELQKINGSFLTDSHLMRKKTNTRFYTNLVKKTISY